MPYVSAIQTEEQKAEFQRLWLEGVTASEIARRFGITETHVRTWRKKLDLPKRKAGINPEILARMVARDADIWARMKRGESIQHIAYAHGLKIENVEAAIEREASRQRIKTTTRACLRCRKPFESHGPGNRMCEGCRTYAATAAAGFEGVRW